MTDEHRQHLYDLLSDFHTAMLVTTTGPQAMRARPMAIAELKADADAYFMTSIDSPKIDEIERNPQVLLTLQSGAKFASVRGTAEVVRDPALIGRFWRETWRVWFPQGKDDPSLCLIRFDATEGEYWDRAGAKGLKFTFDAIKAYVHGRRPSVDETQHGRTKL